MGAHEHDKHDHTHRPVKKIGMVRTSVGRDRGGGGGGGGKPERSEPLQRENHDPPRLGECMFFSGGGGGGCFYFQYMGPVNVLLNY